jgi:hypothetical protein
LDRVARPAWLDYGLSPEGGWRHRLGVGLAVAFGLAVITAGLVGIANGTSKSKSTSTASPRVASRAATPSQASQGLSPGAGLTWHTSSTAVPAGSPVQEQYDQAFSQGLGSLPGMAVAQTLTAPTPEISGGWPTLPVEVSPERWAEAFTAGLLDVDYSHQSRATLAAWLQAQEAPELMPGVPSSVADKVLYISLLDPGLFGGQPTPVASATQWLAQAQTGTSQTVSDVIVQPDPGWAQTAAAGWQPADIRMTEEDVSGVLTVRRDRSAVTYRFGMQIMIGSARWHDGYGTVAVAGWQER